MISRKTLRELVDQKLKDADILFVNRRYDSAIYISGYVLELALKLKICKTYKLGQGFPENKSEFNNYQNSTKSKPLLAGSINQIKDIRNHDLSGLLIFSGAEYRVNCNLFNA